jgi:hypothetical protein
MPEPDLARADYAAYFERWDSVLHYPNPALPKEYRQKIYGYSGDQSSVPCYRHRTCGALVRLGAFDLGKYPPRICPGCMADTAEEVTSGDR